MSRTVVALVVAAALAAGCTAEPSRTEVLRRPSPDGALDAVVIETNGGASTPFGYLLFLPRRGCGPSGGPLLRVVGATRNAAGAAGVAVGWTGPRSVSVDYLDARFSAPPGPVAVRTAAGEVVVTPRAGVADSLAAPGAMSGRRAPATSTTTEDC